MADSLAIAAQASATGRKPNPARLHVAALVAAAPPRCRCVTLRSSILHRWTRTTYLPPEASVVVLRASLQPQLTDRQSVPTREPPRRSPRRRTRDAASDP
ncbi:hypothetical protein TCAP_01223 [Tolypocladium capitatum]|uniref:Uncharacterized protein n=1 Tax=Tolypocladium capitatum TaxID=45235 RepID=A0A2K3QMT8_9HYPO|nr:hypothetical protein TCAP_01223 [Tolypocladium capitatum]